MSSVASTPVSGKPDRYGVAVVNGEGVFQRFDTAETAHAFCSQITSRAYVYDYAAKMTVYRNWEGGAA